MPNGGMVQEEEVAVSGLPSGGSSAAGTGQAAAAACVASDYFTLNLLEFQNLPDHKRQIRGHFGLGIKVP